MIVCHMSSAHKALDVRIFRKECCSLAKIGYETHLVIPASAEDELVSLEGDVTIHRLDFIKSRTKRMLVGSFKCFLTAYKIKANIYHFHDPELIFYGMLLSALGKKVIYDVHEDLPRDILSKAWLPSWCRKFIARFASFVEYIGAKYFFSIVAATSTIGKRFVKECENITVVNNYPILKELDAVDKSLKRDLRTSYICYVGGISEIRGIKELINALSLCKEDVILILAGNFASEKIEKEVKSLQGWKKVEFLGWVNREKIKDVLGKSAAGVVTLHPLINYLDSVPVKMYEYMGAAIPVIASNFDSWKSIIEVNKCGICVNPRNPKDIAKAIDFLVANKATAVEMGEKGNKMVYEKFNWSNEFTKLEALYCHLSEKTSNKFI